ncbi:MAG: sialidase family protein [Elusimicrobiota bacterium]|nr:sialidase family protein [Elusimicrobiota bacterium]
MHAILMLWLAGAAAAQTTGFDLYAEGAVLHRIEGEGGAIFYRRSPDAGGSWSEPARVDAGRPAPYRFGAGDARVAADGGTVLVVWSAKGTGPMGTGGLVVAKSTDAGRTWSAAASPSGDGVFGRRFPALTASAGVFTAAWLDRRSNAKVMAARSSDGGATWSTPALLDDDVCECCWNAAWSSGERTFVLYRDKDPRDMAVSATGDGKTWRSKPVSPFDWRFNGCPHVGGALAERGGTLYSLVWTGKQPEMGLYAVGGEGAPRRLGGTGAKHGDLTAAGGRLAAVWDEDGAVWAATSADGRSWSRPRRLSGAKTRAAHPRVVPAGAAFRAFWLEKADDKSPARLRDADIR